MRTLRPTDGNLFLPTMAIRIATFLPCFVLGEEPFAAGKAIWLEEEAENDGAVGCHRLMPVAGRPPDELPGAARALVILEGALEHERLLQRGVLVQRPTAPGSSLNRAVVMPLSSL